jgi:ankyrin repeat protein
LTHIFIKTFVRIGIIRSYNSCIIIKIKLSTSPHSIVCTRCSHPRAKGRDVRSLQFTFPRALGAPGTVALPPAAQPIAPSSAMASSNAGMCSPDEAPASSADGVVVAESTPSPSNQLPQADARPLAPPAPSDGAASALLDIVFLVSFTGFSEASLASTSCKRLYEDARLLEGIVNVASGPRKRTRLMHAAMCNDVRRLQLYLSAGANVDQAGATGWTPLMFAAGTGAVEAVRMLLLHKADVRLVSAAPGGHDALSFAVHGGHDALGALLVQAGADANGVDADGVGILHKAVVSGLEATAVSLVEAGARLGVTDTSQRGVIHWAAEHNMPRLISALVDRGVSPDAVSGLGEAPIHLAAKFGNTGAAERLLDCGCDVNRPTRIGDTALIFACSQGQSSVANLLVDRGANIHATNDVRPRLVW